MRERRQHEALPWGPEARDPQPPHEAAPPGLGTRRGLLWGAWGGGTPPSPAVNGRRRALPTAGSGRSPLAGAGERRPMGGGCQEPGGGGGEAGGRSAGLGRSGPRAAATRSASTGRTRPPPAPPPARCLRPVALTARLGAEAASRGSAAPLSSPHPLILPVLPHRAASSTH